MPEQSEETKQQGPRTGQIGRTGTINTDGWIFGTEENPDLKWPRSLTVFDNMRRTEITVRAMLAYLTMPLRASECTVEAVSDEEIDQEVAAFTNQVFREVEGGWDDVIRRMLSYLAMGFWVGEKVWEYRTIKYDGKERQAYVIAAIPDRLQRTIHKWHDNNGHGPLTEIEQWVADGIADPTIRLPREKCVLLVNEQEGSDYFGNSILRPAYGAFANKRKLEVIESIGIERSVGVIVAYPPTSAGDTVLDEAEEQLEKLHQAESMYLISPGPKQQAGGMGDGWLFETLDVKGDAGTAKANEAIERYKTEMAQNVLAEFMRLGHNETGARATGETQSNPYVDAVRAVGSQLGQVIREEIVCELVRVNFGEDVEAPTVRFTGLDKADVGQLADAFTKFATGGGLTITAKDEAHIRASIGFPEIEEAEREEIKAQKVAEQQAIMAKAANIDPEAAKHEKPMPPAGKHATEHEAEKAHALSASPLPNFTPRRELVGPEHYVAWDVIDRSIDSHRAEFAMAGKLHVEKIAAAFADGKKPSVDDLAASLADELAETADFGAQQVSKELARQAATRETFEIARMPEGVSKEIERRARLAAEAVIASVGVAVRRAKIDFLRRRGEDRGKVIDAGLEAGRVALRDEALENVTATLNLGRDAQAQQQGVTLATYSSVLDSGTCDPCASADGTETTVASPTYSDIMPPNPDCQGGNRCKCIWVYTGTETI